MSVDFSAADLSAVLGSGETATRKDLRFLARRYAVLYIFECVTAHNGSLFCMFAPHQ